MYFPYEGAKLNTHNTFEYFPDRALHTPLSIILHAFKEIHYPRYPFNFVHCNLQYETRLDSMKINYA